MTVDVSRSNATMQLSAICALSLLGGWLAVAAAQPLGKVPRVGYLSPGSAADPVRMRRFEAFRQGLRALYYVEGQPIALETRWAEGQYDQYPTLTVDLDLRKGSCDVTR